MEIKKITAQFSKYIVYAVTTAGWQCKCPNLFKRKHGVSHKFNPTKEQYDKLLYKWTTN